MIALSTDCPPPPTPPPPAFQSRTEKEMTSKLLREIREERAVAFGWAWKSVGLSYFVLNSLWYPEGSWAA